MTDIDQKLRRERRLEEKRRYDRAAARRKRRERRPRPQDTDMDEGDTCGQL